jgi:hypothetical protein
VVIWGRNLQKKVLHLRVECKGNHIHVTVVYRVYQFWNHTNHAWRLYHGCWMVVWTAMDSAESKYLICDRVSCVSLQRRFRIQKTCLLDKQTFIVNYYHLFL